MIIRSVVVEEILAKVPVGSVYYLHHLYMLIYFKVTAYYIIRNQLLNVVLTINIIVAYYMI